MRVFDVCDILCVYLAIRGRVHLDISIGYVGVDALKNFLTVACQRSSKGLKLISDRTTANMARRNPKDIKVVQETQRSSCW